MSEEPITIQGEYLVNVYSKAIQPKRQTLCRSCVFSLKEQIESDPKPADSLRTRKGDIIRVGDTIIQHGTCKRCGVVL